MALQDILDSIIGEADKRIADATATHRERMKVLREENDRATMRKRTQIGEELEQKKRQLKEKAESHVRMVRNKALIAKKQEYMNDVYGQVLQQLSNMPKDTTEKFLKACLSHVHGKGVLSPSKTHEAFLKNLLPAGCEMGKAISAAGGFIFSSEKEEHNFTFEFLVHDLLKPATEIQAAQLLFPATKAHS